MFTVNPSKCPECDTELTAAGDCPECSFTAHRSDE